MSTADSLLLAIDLGTGSCRAALFDPSGRQVAIGQREYVHAPEPGVPGSQTFDTTAVWALLGSCIREALGKAAAAGAGGQSASAGIAASAAARVAAVAATSMREGMVLYDAAGRELWACPNVDSRAGEQAVELVRSGAAQRIFDLAGDWVAITSPARFRWIAERRPEVLAATAHVGMLGDWVATRLCGSFVTDPSLGSSSGMFDLAKRDWSPEIVSLCGLDPAIVPPVREPGSVIGEVSARAAEETGLRPGTPVVLGGADTQMALTGIGVRQPGRLSIVGGTFWQTTQLSDEPVIDPEARLRTLCHSTPDRWMIEGIGFYCGMVMRWFRDGFCELELAEAARSGADPYELLEEKASRLEAGAGGLVGVFSDVMHARSWKHAAPSLIGFDVNDPARSGRIACFRAIEEAAAYVARGHRDILAGLTGIDAPSAMFTGGAAKGRLWPQIVADVLGVGLQVPEVKESAALGAALYAGQGAGLWPDAGERGEQVCVIERSVEPRPGEAERYRELYRRWQEVYAHELELVERGLAAPLWHAAGA